MVKRPAITSTPNIMGGDWVVAGTRIPIERILHIVRHEYPQLTKQEIERILEALDPTAVDAEAQKRVEDFMATFPNPAYSEEYVQAKIEAELRDTIVLAEVYASRGRKNPYERALDDKLKELEQNDG